MLDEALKATPRLRLPWALVPVALLLCSAIGVGSMAVLAVRDPHFATEPDYYQKAVSWDRTQAQAASNQRLGYSVELPSVIRMDARNRVALEVTLRDRRGDLVRGARLSTTAFANAFSGQLQHAIFEETSSGRYRGQLIVGHAGQWVFEIVGDANGQRFTEDVRADLIPGDDS